MTKEEAIKILIRERDEDIFGGYTPHRKKIHEAETMAIEALKAQDRPIICPRCGRTFAESEGREHE